MKKAAQEMFRSALGRQVLVTVVLAALFLGGVAIVMQRDDTSSSGSTGARSHPRIPNPASLTGARAESVYQSVRANMRRKYAEFDEPLVSSYQSWRRFNRVPYRSAKHGERFVNHYGNEKASQYGRFEKLEPLPPGAIVVKDSFVVTTEGALMTGPLFVMEKMGPGFKSPAGNWRFWTLRSYGSLVGMTGGLNAEKVRFCGECHRKAGAQHDFLYFVPPDVRLPQ